jgi:autotransporter passenger strand-loop-strand repeat protein
MKINLTYNSTVTASNFSGGATEEAAFKSALNYVVSEYESLFTNPVTVNITIGWGTPSHPSDLGHSSSNLENYTYSQIKSALSKTATASGDSAQSTAVSYLPSTNPFGSGKITVTTAEAKALGLLSATDPASDGTVNFNSKDAFSFTPGVTPAAGVTDFIGVAEHEFSEVMGRISSENSAGTGASLIDLYRFSSPGVASKKPITSYGTSYFSYDGGTTNLGSWNNDSNHGDLADWWSKGPAPGGNDAFNDFSNSGVLNALTTTDVTLMNVLGWDTAYSSNQIPGGVTGWIPSGLNAYNVLGGGYLEVGSSGQSWGTNISAGGSAQIDAGGSDIGMNIVGGTDTVFGTEYSATVSGTVSNYGYIYVEAGGVAQNTTIENGGQVIMSAGGSVSGTTVESGGALYADGGKATGTTVDKGGTLVVDGASASGTIIASGGWETVAKGGTDSGTTIQSGGYEFVMSGGTINGATINGGTVEMGDGALAGSNPTAFGSSGGTLRLDAASTFSGSVSNFGPLDHLDLRDIAFGTKTTLGFAEASNNLSGTLTVSDGSHTASIGLLGQYMASQFTMASDGGGGTLIGEAPLMAAASPHPVTLAAAAHG